MFMCQDASENNQKYSSVKILKQPNSIKEEFWETANWLIPKITDGSMER